MSRQKAKQYVQLSELQPGDIVRKSAVYEVTRAAGGSIRAKDVKDGKLFGLYDTATTRIQLLHRPGAHLPRPKVGTTLSADQIRKTPWKRGTVISQPGVAGSGILFILEASGLWRRLNSYAYSLDFEDLHESYRVEYLPED